MKSRRLAAVVVCGLLFAACSGEDDPVDTTAPATPATAAPTAPPPTAASTTATTTSTTVISSTAPTTAPTTPPTTPPTAPTSTIDLATPTSFTAIGDISAEERGAIETSMREAFDAYDRALVTPNDEPAVQLAYSFAVGTRLDVMTAQINQFRADNQAIRPSDLYEPSLTILQGPSRLLETPGDVVLVVCEFDPWVVVEVGAEPDGSDRVVDDSIIAGRAEVYMRVEGGTWKIYRYRLDRVFRGATECRE